jgi:Protein kinase domain
MKTLITCPEDHELLALLAGDSAAEPLRAHAQECPQCKLRLDRLRAEVSAIRMMLPVPVPSTPVPVHGLHRSSPRNGSSPPDCPVGDEEHVVIPSRVAGAPLGRDHDLNQHRSEEERDLPAAIGKYLVVGRFPESGQAEVFRVVHPELHRDLVLKLARRPVGEDGLSDVLADGQRLAELEHPNIVRVYDLDFFDGRPYLVMEFIRGRTLTQYAREEQITPRLAAAHMVELASAVAFAHRRGIVHQDIKPANVLIDEAGTLRLIDFGLGWQHDTSSGTRSHSEGGTFAFMAPEQARFDLERVRPLCDVFSIGAVLYFLLTGSGPFAAGSAEESWDRARHCKLDRSALKNAGVPRVLERICLKALAGEPEQRYRSAAQLERALRRFLRLRRIKFTLSAAGVVVAMIFGVALAYPRLLMPQSMSGTASVIPHAAVVLPAAEPALARRFVLNVEHMSPQGEDAFTLRGNLGERSFSVQAGDDVTIQAQLPEPAYAYLIAYRPDGVDEICDPADPDVKPRKTASLGYPPPSKSDRVYRLNDGFGLHAFALVVSKAPLPSYRDWKSRHGTPPWGKGLSASPGIVWSDDGRQLAALTVDRANGERGAGATIRGGGAAVAELAAWLRAIPGIDVVVVKAFPVPLAPRGAVK